MAPALGKFTPVAKGVIVMSKKQTKAASPAATSQTPKPAAAGAPTYFARRPMTYAGVPYDREQVIVLSGQPNDERLVRLGYVGELGTVKPIRCSACGAAFRTVGALEQHGTKRHTAVAEARPSMAPRQPGESDVDYDRRVEAFRRDVLASEQAREQREERELEREAPLNWENTQASRAEAGI